MVVSKLRMRWMSIEIDLPMLRLFTKCTLTIPGVFGVKDDFCLVGGMRFWPTKQNKRRLF